ncbi:MAG: response regulator [Acidithiobacillales bacterium]
MSQSQSQSSYRIPVMRELLAKKLTRPVVGSLVGCVHCGMCNAACHYVLTHPDDPKMTPSFKADQLRKLFKYNYDWTGKVFPWWVGAKEPLTDADLDVLKDIAFGTCTNCRRCTLNCPMGVDTAVLNRIMRGLLSAVGVMPEGVRVVSKDQWEIGNQMGVLKEDYLETLDWMSDELASEVGDESARIPVDKRDCEVLYTINPREAKYDPRTIAAAAKIFWAAAESWTMPSEGWDQTNFGLFSGDDQLGGAAARRVFEKLKELSARRIVISECGHGYRSTRCEGPNWAGIDQDFEMESSIFTMLRYVREGRIVVDPAKLGRRVTYHDSCNLARSCGITEEPRELLRAVATDFVEMIPNRAENFCCTGGGGAMSMSEYTPRRLKSARIKADQIAATGATIVVTSCHNCVDGLNDLIKHYKLGCEVKQLVDLVADALVIEECAVKKKPKGVVEMPKPAFPLKGRRILVVDDEADIRLFLRTVLEDAGAEVYEAADGNQAIAEARRRKPDLITLDLSMEQKDGIETFAELRSDNELAGIPVCVVTGHPEFREVIYSRAVPPPDGYMDKPIKEEELVENIWRILGLHNHKTHA